MAGIDKSRSKFSGTRFGIIGILVVIMTITMVTVGEWYFTDEKNVRVPVISSIVSGKITLQNFIFFLNVDVHHF